MRRSLLTVTVLCFAGWSQPAQQQAQPPIVINNVMPREGFWMGFFKVAIPTILAAVVGSGIAFYGLKQTNKHHAAESAANRKHQLDVEIAKAEIAAEYKSQDNRWAFRKEVYTALLGSIHDQITAYSYMISYHPTILQAGVGNDSAIAQLRQNNVEQFLSALRTFTAYATLAPLAMAETTVPLVVETVIQAGPLVDTSSPDHIPDLRRRIALLQQLQSALQTAGRKDLWGTPKSEVKAEATT